jgi:hypothetical protein
MQALIGEAAARKRAVSGMVLTVSGYLHSLAIIEAICHIFVGVSHRRRSAIMSRVVSLAKLVLVPSIVFLVGGCSDNPTEQATPPVARDVPFRIVYPLQSFVHDKREALVMTWQLHDTLLTELHTYYRPAHSAEWIYDTTVAAGSGRHEFRLDALEKGHYRFALATPDARYCDSTALVSLVIARPFEILYPRQPVNLDRNQSFVLTWKVNDNAVTDLRISYRSMQDTEWTQRATVPAASGSYEFRPRDLPQQAYRFALSTLDGSFRDSSAVLSFYLPAVMLLEPSEGELKLQRDAFRFKWKVHDPEIRNVELRWAYSGSTTWRSIGTFEPRDSVYILPEPPWDVGSTVDFAVRGLYANLGPSYTEWTYVRDVSCAVFSITDPLPGAEWYRYLQAKIVSKVVVPKKYHTADTITYELSTNGGVTWMPTPPAFFLDRASTSSAFVRMHHPGMRISVESGPFSIVDRSAEYFKLYVGRVFRYYRFHVDSTPSTSDTSSRMWRTITVLRERQGVGRTEYECSVLDEYENGDRETSVALLWQRHDGMKMASGNVEPFKDIEIFGIQDISVDDVHHRIVSGTPGELPISRVYHALRRTKGITVKSWSTAYSRFPPRGRGTKYILLE